MKKKNKLNLSDINVERIKESKILKNVKGGAMGNSGNGSKSYPAGDDDN